MAAMAVEAVGAAEVIYLFVSQSHYAFFKSTL